MVWLLMANGQWLMNNGQWLMPHRQRLTANEQRLMYLIVNKQDVIKIRLVCKKYTRI